MYQRHPPHYILYEIIQLYIPLMLKVTYTCLDHRDTMLIAVRYRKVIPDRTTRLNYSSYTRLVCKFHAIRKREVGIRSHNRTIKVKSKGASLVYSLPK